MKLMLILILILVVGLAGYWYITNYINTDTKSVNPQITNTTPSNTQPFNNKSIDNTNRRLPDSPPDDVSNGPENIGTYKGYPSEEGSPSKP